MLAAPRRPEIDHRTIKLLVGVIAMGLPLATSSLAAAPLGSISASYFAGPWPRNIFVGLLIAVASLMLAYNGQSRREMLFAKVAASAGVLVALFPCGCDIPLNAEARGSVHYPAAATMFVILAGFCWSFYRRAIAKGHGQARARATLYLLCAAAILSSVAVLAANAASNDGIARVVPRIVFIGESLALVAFGTSWLVASRVLPGLTRPDERFSPFRANNPA